MEEDKLNVNEGAAQQPKKYSYDELVNIASELTHENKRLVGIIQKQRQDMEALNFEGTSFYVSCLFRVLEQPGAYPASFVGRCAKNLENIISAYESAFTTEEKGKTDDVK